MRIIATNRNFGDDIFYGCLLTGCLLLILSGTWGCIAWTCEWKRGGRAAWHGYPWYRCQISWWVNSIF